MAVFVYGVTLGALITTNAAGGTANNYAYMKPGAARTAKMVKVDVIGKGIGLTALSGVSHRIEVWTTTASSNNGLTPAAKDIRTPASSATAGMSATTVTSGTGGPTVVASFGHGATGPGGWVARNQDDGYALDAAMNKSVDLFNACGTASIPLEATFDIEE